MRKVISFGVTILMLVALAGCNAPAASNNDLSFVDSLNCLNNPIIWEYTETDLVSLGTEKTNNEYSGTDYVKNTLFCGFPGKITFNLGDDGGLSYFYYQSVVPNEEFDNKGFVTNFIAAYGLLNSKYRLKDEQGAKTDANRENAVACTIDTFKNDMQAERYNTAYNYTFYEYDEASDTYGKRIDLSIVVYKDTKERFAMINMACFG